MTEHRHHNRFPTWLRQLGKNPLACGGGVILLVLFVLVTFGPVLAPHSPDTFHITQRFAAPGGEFWLGTDNFGRDIFSRLLYGARPTILFGIVSTLLGTIMGVSVGLLAGYAGGRIDGIIMRGVDVFLAIPNLILILLIVSVLGGSTSHAVMAVALAFAPGMARVTRSAVLTVRAREFVWVCVARGEPGSYIMFAEILPVVLPVVLIESSIRVGFAIMLGATLSYLGLGAQPPSADWGLLIANAREFMFRSPWMVFWPSLSIAVAAFGFNMFGDGLRDAMNLRAIQ